MSLPGIDRRRFLGTTGAATLSARPDLALAQAATGGSSPIRWVGAQPGRLVLDDAPAHVASRFGWFPAETINATPDAAGAGAALRLLAQGVIDVGIASPLELLIARRQGQELVSIAQHVERDGSLLVLPKSALQEGLEPKAIGSAAHDYLDSLPTDRRRLLIGARTWQPTAELLLGRFKLPTGDEPGAFPIAEAGPAWVQAVLTTEPSGADSVVPLGGAALGWRGLTPLWKAAGLEFQAVSPPDSYPGACLVARAEDLADLPRRDLLRAFLIGWAMGLAFTLQNTAAAVQIVQEAASAPGMGCRPPQLVFPAGQEMQAVDRLREALDTACPAGIVGIIEKSWGCHDPAAWKRLAAAPPTQRLLGVEIDPGPGLHDALVKDALRDVDLHVVLNEVERFVRGRCFRDARRAAAQS